MYILLYLTESENKIALETKRPPTYHIVSTNLISSYWVLKDILFLKVSKDFYDDLLIIFLKRSDWIRHRCEKAAFLGLGFHIQYICC